ncbi:hypothetical protein NDK43_07690 [Neobacillus pocheonensis]|uniref:Uncharacterized protein n=1 Tax=Neobacillus pocheonensis TaxID=363869 RepID=A0ABT0W7J5_9BACI|nr:hypothetical protein [Neobacillus pocheonensis]
MSYQTKKQSIGYILKTALKTEIPANRLMDIALASLKIVEDRNDINNHERMNFAEKVVQQIELSEEFQKDLKREMVWTFDNTAVGEAENVYEGFAKLFPVQFQKPWDSDVKRV